MPATLKGFLAALAIIDDLGPVVIIAFLCTASLELWALGSAAIMFVALPGLGRLRVNSLVPHLLRGCILWALVFLSGVDATIAGVLLALTIPIKRITASFEAPVTMGVGLGLFLGKMVGAYGSVSLMVESGLADLPASASWSEIFGVALLCGIGFTMALFVSLLAFSDSTAQDQAKLGILAGSIFAGLAGYLVLSFSNRRTRRSASESTNGVGSYSN